MTHAHAAKIADRRTLLAARAELDRARVTLALHEVRSIIIPAPSGARGGSVRPAAAMLIRLLGPAIGMSRTAPVAAFTIIPSGATSALNTSAGESSSTNGSKA